MQPFSRHLRHPVGPATGRSFPPIAPIQEHHRGKRCPPTWSKGRRATGRPHHRASLSAQPKQPNTTQPTTTRNARHALRPYDSWMDEQSKAGKQKQEGKARTLHIFYARSLLAGETMPVLQANETKQNKTKQRASPIRRAEEYLTEYYYGVLVQVVRREDKKDVCGEGRGTNKNQPLAGQLQHHHPKRSGECCQFPWLSTFSLLFPGMMNRERLTPALDGPWTVTIE